MSKWSLLKEVYLWHDYNFVNFCNRWKLLWYKSGIWRVYWLRRDPRKLSETVKIFCILTGMVVIWRYVFIRTHWIIYFISVNEEKVDQKSVLNHLHIFSFNNVTFFGFYKHENVLCFIIVSVYKANQSFMDCFLSTRS